MLTEALEHYPKIHYAVASSQLVFAMVGMGATLATRDFIEIVKEPKPIITGSVYQLIGIPLLTVLLTTFLKLPPEIVVGMFMLAAMPGGSMSNVYTFLGKGNAALSVALTGLLTLTALVTAPLILRTFASTHLPPEIPMPVGVIIREIALYLLLPLSIGMSINRFAVNAAPIVSKWAIRASLFFLGVLVVGSLGSGRLDITAYGYKIPILIVAYCAFIQLSAEGVSRKILKLSRRDTTAIAIESSMKNINLGLLIAASLFTLEGPNAHFGTGLLFVLLLYGGASLAVSAGPALANYKYQKKNPS
ncbi:MAG: bile acid:sodium symporter [Verrucomicrobiota bacterium]